MFAFMRLFYMCQSLVWRSGGTRFPVLWCAVKSQQLLKKNLAQTADICRAKPKATLGGGGSGNLRAGPVAVYKAGHPGMVKYLAVRGVLACETAVEFPTALPGNGPFQSV